MAFTFDTTLGVALAIALHNIALRVARKFANANSIAAEIAECGTYGALFGVKVGVSRTLYRFTHLCHQKLLGTGTPPSWGKFWPQALEWTTAVILARLLCGSVVVLPDKHWGRTILPSEPFV